MFRKCHREKHRKNQNNMDFWGYWNHTGLEVKFNHLTLLKIIDFHGTEEELSFVAFILNNSPMIDPRNTRNVFNIFNGHATQFGEKVAAYV